ncbi:MAG: 2-isopropylmalate synthase [Myxococcota bacterium]|nr:2-isopropylmalate synthase [Myxococcota bacterium]
MSRTTIDVVDCTLREGEQTAGVWFSIEEKLALVRELAAAGIHTLDAGMPVVSDAEREFLRRATGMTEAKIGASVRALAEECRLAIDCGCDEVFIICPVSPLHRQSRLGLTETGLLKRIASVVRIVRSAGRVCNVVAEDASRTDPDSLHHALRVALDNGADRIFLCDTVGAWTPSQTGQSVSWVHSMFPGTALGVHCHNDYGMATANTIAAIEAGCDWPTATVNGVGERAGNASLVEVAAASERLLGLKTGVQFERIAALSQRVEAMTGFVIPQHQPIVGYNAFRHESGIHVDGLIKAPDTYQSIAPELVGREHSYVVGKHSGRALLRHFAEQQGYPSDEDTVNAVLEIIKNRRPDWARESFGRVRNALDRYNETCLGVPENRLADLFREVVRQIPRSSTGS